MIVNVHNRLYKVGVFVEKCNKVLVELHDNVTKVIRFGMTVFIPGISIEKPKA